MEGQEWGLQAHEAYGQLGAVHERAQGGGDVCGAGQAEEAYDEVSQAGHHLCAVAFACLAWVFVERHVAHVVQAVLDRPLASGECKELPGRGFLGAATGEAGDDFALDLRGRTGTAMLADAYDLEDLLAVREREVVVELGGGPDTAGVDASMSFVGRLSLRGG